MLSIKNAFSSFSVDNLEKAKEFYSNKLGLEVEDQPGMGLMLRLPGGSTAFIYPKDDHQPATYTVLNFSVASINPAIDELKNQGIELLRYENMHQDDDGVARGKAAGMGPDIAWFADPAGNVLAIIEE